MADKVLETIRQKLESPPSDERMTVRRSATVSVTVAEIKRAIAASPDHPIARVYTSAVKGFDDSRALVVDAADLQAVLDGTEVELTEEYVDGGRVITKVMRRTAPKPAEATQPKPPS